MKYTTLLAGAVAVSDVALASPRMGRLMAELASRQIGVPGSQPVLIGDLVQGATTPVGQQVKDCLLGVTGCEDNTSVYKAPGDLASDACKTDTCCVWDAISKEITDQFLDNDGTCNRLARKAIRLGFHDAGAWSTTSGTGGADGSLILSQEEMSRDDNKGLQGIGQVANDIIAKYAKLGYTVGAADLVQFMHNVATVVCPLGPRVYTFVGRDDSNTPNPAGLIPDHNSPSSVLIELFQNKTIRPQDLVALIGAHTAGNQDFVDLTQAGAPFDSTPGTWDVKFYAETMQENPPQGVVRLASDAAIAADGKTRSFFSRFADPNNGQQRWTQAYAIAYVRLSLLGVNKINQLVDCTGTLPLPNTVGPQPKPSSSISTSSASSSASSSPSAASSPSAWSPANSSASAVPSGQSNSSTPASPSGSYNSSTPASASGPSNSPVSPVSPNPSSSPSASPATNPSASGRSPLPPDVTGSGGLPFPPSTSDSGSIVASSDRPPAQHVGESPSLSGSSMSGSSGSEPSGLSLGLTTSTIYSTSTYTTTSCASTVASCPARSTSIVTSLIPIGTTVCPVSVGAVPTGNPSGAPVKSTDAPFKSIDVSFKPTEAPAKSTDAPVKGQSTNTIYGTHIYTVDSCASGAKNCSIRSPTVITSVGPITTSVQQFMGGAASSHRPALGYVCGYFGLLAAGLLYTFAGQRG